MSWKKGREQTSDKIPSIQLSQGVMRILVSLSHVHRGASIATTGSIDHQSISWMKVKDAPKVGRT